jgi:hypothetical protein
MVCGCCLDIGTQMAFIRLPSGKFLVVDTIDPTAEEKAEIDKLTNNGALIEAVIATHAFHTLFFPTFFKMYPNAEYYGTARHLKNQPTINWKGDIANNLSKWESDGVYIRCPEGCDLLSETHFAGLFVFDKLSRTLFNDDTIMYFDNPSCLIKLTGLAEMQFHTELTNALYKTETGPIAFANFIRKILNDWDFDNICVAHSGRKIGTIS